MEVLSGCPLRVGSVLWQPRPGTWTLTVVCKATFDLVPEEADLAEVQEDPNGADKHWNDDLSRSLYASRDLVPFKPRADVVLVGHAFAPRGEAVRMLVARLAVGEMSKAIEIHGDRFWTSSGMLREGAPFAKMPLRYERAAWGADNPVGVRPDAPPNANGLVPLPNLQRPGTRVSSRQDPIQPFGFGPIAPRWPARTKLLDLAGAAWLTAPWATQPIPAGIDASYFNAAPMDQRLEQVHPDERIVLENLHASHARLITRLPGASPHVVVERAGAAPDVLLMRGDTLWIDTDRALCTVTWRGHVRLDHPSQQGRIVVSMRSVRRRSQSEDSIRAALASETGGLVSQRGLPPDADPAATLQLGMEPVGPAGAVGATTAKPGLPRGPVLPFAQAPAAPARPPESPVAAPPKRDTDILPPPIVAAVPILADSAPLVPMTVGQAAARDADAKGSEAGAPGKGGRESAPVVADGAAAKGAPLKLVPGLKARAGSAGAVSGAAARPRIASLADLKELALSKEEEPHGALASSNAAATDSSAEASAAQPEPPRAPQPATRKAPSAVVELLWFDAAFVETIRGQPGWKDIMAEIKPKPRDADANAGALAAKCQEAKDRREITGLLVRADPVAADGLGQALRDAVDEDGRFVPPLVIATGELQLHFDEVETLKATIAAVTPLATGDKKLKETIDTVTELLRTPWSQGAPSIAEGLTAQIKEAFAQGHRVLPHGYLEMHTERMLLDHRHYQKRTVLGQQFIRSLLALPGAVQPIPTYLPASIGRELPAFQRFQARLMAEVRVQLDQHESAPIALRAVAVGRTLSALGRRA